MIDPKYFRQQLAEASEKLAKRGFVLDVTAIEALEQQRKVVQQKTQDLQSQRNQYSREIGILKSQGKEASDLMQQVGDINTVLADSEIQLQQIQAQLEEIYLRTPNLPQDDVPAGRDEKDNVCVRTWGEKIHFDFTPKDHVALTESSRLMDFELGAKISGARFVVMRRDIAYLYRALSHFFLDVQVQQHGYEEVIPPYLVNTASLMGTGQLPKFKEDLFHTEGEHDLWLIPTAEVPLTNIVRDTVIDTAQLPLKFTAFTPCFRSEAGSYGKDTRGMIRQHQFEKVEMVHITHPEQSNAALEEMVSHAERLLQMLKLPYRVMLLCAGDMGFAAAKTYDLEVWLPGQQQYREISSCSNCEAFQARRMQARYRDATMKKPEFVHTLNGSGLPLGRTLVAIIENYQDASGRIHVPEVLQHYLNGKKVIE